MEDQIMSSAKLTLSPEEMKLVTDPGVILTKNSVMEKVVALMAGLSEEYRGIWEGVAAEWAAAEGLERASPKISRGENYRGLPWVMLDHPRWFGREDVFAVRTMFWWGHTFSVTLHLKGCYKELYLPVIEKNWQALAAAGFHVGVSADEWRHEHAPDNYGLVSRAEDLKREVDFLKLSAAVGLHRWEGVPAALLSMFKTLISVLF
jgi:hypothetical protein